LRILRVAELGGNVARNRIHQFAVSHFLACVAQIVKEKKCQSAVISRWIPALVVFKNCHLAGELVGAGGGNDDIIFARRK